MKKYLSDLAAVLKGDGIALDDTEAALIGAPSGETVSLYAALAALLNTLHQIAVDQGQAP